MNRLPLQTRLFVGFVTVCVLGGAVMAFLLYEQTAVKRKAVDELFAQNFQLSVHAGTMHRSMITAAYDSRKHVLTRNAKDKETFEKDISLQRKIFEENFAYVETNVNNSEAQEHIDYIRTN